MQPLQNPIPENVPRERYQRIVYFNQEKVSLESYHNGPGVEEEPTVQPAPHDVGQLAEEILSQLVQKNMSFAQLLEHFSDEQFGAISRAVGHLNEEDRITQDEKGRYQLRKDNDS